MRFASWIVAWCLCRHLVLAANGIPLGGAAPDSMHSVATLTPLRQELLALDGEVERWNASPQARNRRAHQSAMEGFALRRVELLALQARPAGDEAKARRLEEQRMGAPLAPPLALERQGAAVRQTKPETQHLSPNSREEVQ